MHLSPVPAVIQSNMTVALAIVCRPWLMRTGTPPGILLSWKAFAGHCIYAGTSTDVIGNSTHPLENIMQNRTTVILTSMVIGASLISVAKAQDTALKKSSELQVLDRYVGSWEETVISKPALWTPERTTTTITSTRKWILNGQMIENKGAWLPGKNEFLHLMTYDPQRKEYRQWYYDKDNLVPQVYRGKWDEATQTFTFTGPFADGIQATGQQKWLNKDTFTWTLEAKDRTGKVVLDMEAKCVRKK